MEKAAEKRNTNRDPRLFQQYFTDKSQLQDLFPNKSRALLGNFVCQPKKPCQDEPVIDEEEQKLEELKQEELKQEELKQEELKQEELKQEELLQIIVDEYIQLSKNHQNTSDQIYNEMGVLINDKMVDSNKTSFAIKLCEEISRTALETQQQLKSISKTYQKQCNRLLERFSEGKCIQKFYQLGGQQYFFQKWLGKGAYGKVLLVKTKEKQFYALKIIPRQSCQPSDFLNEIAIPFQLKQNNSMCLVPTLFNVYQNQQDIFLLMEYIVGQNLETFLSKKCFSEAETGKILKDLVETLQQMHLLGFVY